MGEGRSLTQLTTALLPILAAGFWSSAHLSSIAFIMPLGHQLPPEGSC